MQCDPPVKCAFLLKLHFFMKLAWNYHFGSKKHEKTPFLPIYGFEWGGLRLKQLFLENVEILSRSLSSDLTVKCIVAIVYNIFLISNWTEIETLGCLVCFTISDSIVAVGWFTMRLLILWGWSDLLDQVETLKLLNFFRSRVWLLISSCL